MKCLVRLANVLGAVLFLALSIPALSLEPPGPGEIEQYRKDGSLAERIKFAKSLQNYKFHPSLVQRKIAKIKALKEGRPFIPQVFPYSTGLPSHGTPRMFAILIDFPDYPHTNEQSVFISKLFGTGDPGESPYESLTEYYKRSSYDALSIQGDVHGWYTAQHNRDHYGSGSWPYPGVKELIKEAMDYYDPTHDFSQYDNNDDGIIDYFCIFWTGPDGGWSSLWWAWCDMSGYMFSGDSYAVDGKQLGIFAWQWEGRPVGSEFAPETVIHETGHGLGLPDYYDYDSSVGPDGGVGGLDMMDSYGGHNAFSKWLLDWVTPTVVGDWGEAGTLTLRASSSYPDCVTIMPGQTASDYFAEYFMVQNRSRLGNDQDIPADGLLIWHVDARLNDWGTDFKYDNSFAEHKLLRLMEADGSEEIETGDGRADAGDFYVQGKTFSPYSTPNSNDYVGSYTGVIVQNISAGSSTMTADFLISSPAANQPPNTPSAPTGDDSGTPSTSYSFTATTTDPDGDQVVYNFHWGDDSESGWTSPVDSGSSVSVSHSWSNEGTYEVKVKAKDTSDAESGWSSAHQIEISRANQSPHTPSNSSPSDGATSQSIDVDLSWTGGDPDSDPVTYDVYFKANDSNFGEPVSPGQSGTTYDPGTLGYDTHYYWKIVATDDHGASTEGPVWDFITGSSGRHDNEWFSLPAGKWEMISIPFTLDDPSPNAVLVDDLGEQSDAVWKLYRWNTANGSYDKYPYTGDFAAAKAFWIVSKDAKEVDTGPGTDVSRETNFVINLPSGWSQIGNPFPFSVAWGEVMVRKDGEEVSISEAQGKEWVRDTIWYWDGQSYLFDQAPSGVLNPYEGYWVRALLNCELLVPPSGAQEARAWEQVVKPKEEFLQLKARVGEIEDSYNFLGFYQTAKDDYDRLDVEEAPPISPYISLFFPHPEWGKNKGDYTQDIRTQISRAGLKQIWDFQVKTDQINREIVLEWENTSAFPEDLWLYLTDSFSNVLANMREKSSYSFISSSGLESFKVIATSEALALPEDLDLIEVYSYPNPAHGDGARFHFHLASSAKLTIKIYSISGELVRTLIKDEVYLPGVYEEFWKEDNDRGEKLARGLYIFIIQAGNPAKAMSKSGKVVLLD